MKIIFCLPKLRQEKLQLLPIIFKKIIRISMIFMK
ncbi:Hypothetical Protein SLY_0744 [Strawberry lethal yellows phytoplasma (CPA) str. NZSb11]|uniref:Uncharacterized protein n=1 Tax=Strawberry lethal yellows phytoplasma (CPA) str. NZSb11 TaxID=980422 RepID=R4S1I1_PHYAS|nr:Hypothetical Protein SLY_0744 [Strawberry lethal yellows phytoplasma (CPA) str. NZSb11]